MPTGLRRAIAISEVPGGVLGLLSVMTFARAGGVPAFVLLVLSVLGGLSILAGVALWRNDILGRRISLVLMAAQVVQVQSTVLAYRVLLGVQFSVWIRNGGGFGVGI